MNFSFILIIQLKLVSHNGLILLGNNKMIGLSLKHTFFNLFNPMKTFLSIDTILY